MYGLINKAVRALIVSQYGEATWLEIVKLAGCQALFISNTSYPDETTYGALPPFIFFRPSLLVLHCREAATRWPAFVPVSQSLS
jgi:hypothetical protein